MTNIVISLYRRRKLNSYYINNEMRLLLDTYFYSMLYYNAVLWLTPYLCSTMRQALLSISANALRSCMLFDCPDMFFVRIHSICQKCTPAQIMSYQAAIHLFKVINKNFEYCTTEHALLLNNIICPPRQLKFEIFRSNHTKIGMNALSNKFHHISKLISFDNLNLGFVHFKKFAKIKFLKNGKT